jgi:hypothetical protein
VCRALPLYARRRSAIPQHLAQLDPSRNESFSVLFERVEYERRTNSNPCVWA